MEIGQRIELIFQQLEQMFLQLLIYDFPFFFSWNRNFLRSHLLWCLRPFLKLKITHKLRRYRVCISSPSRDHIIWSIYLLESSTFDLTDGLTVGLELDLITTKSSGEINIIAAIVTILKTKFRKSIPNSKNDWKD